MCYLYYEANGIQEKIALFRNRAKAEEFWQAIGPALERKMGTKLKPIYVETGKGRGK